MKVGDPVRILRVPEEEAQRQLDVLRRFDGFGGWAKDMAQELGTAATVSDLNPSRPGRVRLRHAATTWSWATTLVVRVRPGTTAVAMAAVVATILLAPCVLKKSFVCVAPHDIYVAYRKSPRLDDLCLNPLGPKRDDIVDAEWIAPSTPDSAGERRGRSWLKLSVRGIIGDAYLPMTNAAGEVVFEAWGGGVLKVGDPVRILRVPEEEAQS